MNPMHPITFWAFWTIVIASIFGTCFFMWRADRREERELMERRRRHGRTVTIYDFRTDTTTVHTTRVPDHVPTEWVEEL
jgi:uncharacterized membrane protein